MTTSNRDISPPPLKCRKVLSGQPSPNLAPNLPSRPITIIAPHQLRIFTWNVNGIAPFIAPPSPSFGSPRPDLRSLRECLKRWKYPQLVCLQEVKINRSDIRTQDALHQIIRAPGGSQEWGYSTHFGLPRDRFNARGFGGKVYGVCTLIRNDFVAAEEVSIRELDWDLEGRVLAIELPKQKLVIFNVYAINGTSNPYHDPGTGLNAFYSKRMAWQTVIAGDLNIARGPEDGFPGRRMKHDHVLNRADFEDKFMKSKDGGGLGMKDSFRELHGGERKYSYRGRGCQWGVSADRVDLILVPAGMIQIAESWGAGASLVEADILDEEAERGPSDHVPSYVTLEL
ncbi:MAG: hypothetical protein MMC33_003559 [Icmadophila ericetorum]|nr:hypothetical protein [Icmadophila ericetorum]